MNGLANINRSGDLHIETEFGSDLGGLLALDDSSLSVWTDADLAEVCEFQLAAPLVIDLRALEPRIDSRLDAWNQMRSFDERIRTAGELFAHRAPPLWLLRLIKDFAIGATGDHTTLPRRGALLMYALAVACAKVRLGRMLSASNSDERFLNALSQFERETWPDTRTRETLRELRHALTELLVKGRKAV